MAGALFKGEARLCRLRSLLFVPAPDLLRARPMPGA
jgi:hypothetical protein